MRFIVRIVAIVLLITLAYIEYCPSARAEHFESYLKELDKPITNKMGFVLGACAVIAFLPSKKKKK